MQIGLLFVLIIAVLVYFLNRQKSQMNRLRTYRRFQPDWSRSRAGSRRRRRSRYSGLRAEMTRLEEEREEAERQGTPTEPGEVASPEPDPSPGDTQAPGSSTPSDSGRAAPGPG